jgi:hypothetical protein
MKQELLMKMNLRYAIAAVTAAMTVSPAAFSADSDVEGLLDAFRGTEVNGWVAGSYLHRLDESSDKNLDTTYFSHPDANTFSLDQAWISFDKAPTEESRAGFHLDYVYGKIAEAQGGDDDSGLIYSGWVSYLAPIGSGVEFKAGRLTTFLGGEVLETNGNNSITRGIVYGLQPITHTGVSATGSFSESIGWGFGVVNDVYDDTFTDDSSNKAVTGQISWSNDTTYAGFSFIYGQDQSQGCAPNGDCNLGIYDFLVTSDLSDNLSVWANVDYLVSDGDDLASDGSALGVSLNGRVAVSEKTGLSLRVEYIDLEDDFIGAADDLAVWAVTGTTDTMLTDKLMLRGEMRYDYSDDDTIFGFADDRGTLTNDSQLTAMIELIYNFRAP